MTVEASLVARFRADLEAVTGAVPSPGRRLGLAVSGGGDSLALLLLASAAYPGAVVAATVDHGLRAGAAAEADAVGRLCGRLGVPHDVLRGLPGETIGGNVQDGARRLRYALLAGWAAGDATIPFPRAAWVATGHQRDDVAETFLMRARRGAGVKGLAAMATCRPIIARPGAAALVRPLLGRSRAELAGIVRSAGLVAADDPTNADPRFERTRVRALLAVSPGLSPAGLALAARTLRDAEQALAWVTDREWHARAAIEPGGAISLDVSDLPHELRRRLADRALEHLRAEFGLATAWRGSALERLVMLLEAGRAATLAGVRARPGERWRFDLAPPRRLY